MKKTYYIHLGSGEISQKPIMSGTHFQIEATENEIKELRRIFEEMHHANLGSYVRSHVPFLEYHYDAENDQYDGQLKKAYELIYKLGNEETRQFLKENHIISSINIE